MSQNKTMIGHLLGLFTIIIWGTTYVSTKVLLKDFTPIEILFFRFFLGLLVLTAIYPHRLKTKGWRQELQFMAAGICGVTLYFMLENTALTITLASHVGIIVAVAPFFTAILAHFFLEGERFQLRFFAGFVVSMAGIICININENFLLKISPIGDLLAVLAAAVWAVYSILAKKISDYGYHTIASTRRIFLYGVLFMLPIRLVLPFSLELHRFTQPVNLLNMLFLSLGASALCYLTWNYAIRLLGAATTSLYIYIVPAVTVLTSWIVLQENITWVAILGAFLTMAGLVISETKFRIKGRKAVEGESQAPG